MRPPRSHDRRRAAAAVIAAAVVAGCLPGASPGDAPAGTSQPSEPDTHAQPPVSPPSAADVAQHTPAGPPPTVEEAMPADPPISTRPSWLGTKVLPLRADGFGEVQPTPPELRDRRLPPPAGFARADQDRFEATVSDVPDEVVARSTWSRRCPVALSDLRYVTVSFWGFDGRAYRGELLIHASAAPPVVGVFQRLFEARFPIEEMRVVSPDEVDAPPTGDGNNTTAFVCRPVRGASSWSQHAYGLAVDINPFHNPYVKGDLVLPELASAYTDRDWHRPGMIHAGDVVTQAFTAIGWGWGGDWRASVDPMHFSRTGR